MKRILVLAALIFPLIVSAQVKLAEAVAEDFSTKAAEKFQQKNDPLLVFVADQMSRSGAGGLEIDKTMTELKKDPAALDAALKYVYQFSDCNRQQLIANLRAMNLQSNNVFPLATYTVNKFKGEAKALIEEKATLIKSGEFATVAPGTPPAAPAQPQPATSTAPTGQPVTPGTSAQETAPATATTPAATPAAPAAPAADPYDWDVRNIFPLTSPDQLAEKFGKENVAARPAQDLEGNDLGTGYYVFPDTDNEMEVVFKEDKSKIVTFTHEHSKWKSPFGIKPGDPLEKLVKINGRAFRINGFDWTNGGMIDSWDGGAMDKKGVTLQLKANNTGDPKQYDQVTGDKKVRSDQAALKKLDVVVEKVSFQTAPQQ
ncbi:hypothetical protein SAMN04488505_10782 [Chitinophaga rupis]|uniref:Uncharacterized protein n=1 Tax=Chitinophaga rupis TaxID=573321 RepID=A0A1H8CE14_9BACT|nr:hypothetical protein [Chitinophaga rupis]SEM93275.1 hypothetical protein SAMN04488505_10782 [Chitinophaga rupis]